MLPETELQGFAGRGEQREEAAEQPRGRNPAAGMLRFCSPERSYKGSRVAGSKERPPPGGREDEIRRRECEDFAPRNEVTRVSGERGAKRGRRRAPGRSKSDGGNVKILLPETELQGFAGRGEQREAGGCPAGHTPGLAQEYVQEKTCIFIHNHVLSYQRH